MEKVEPKAIPNLHILSLHQLKSLLLSSSQADKTSVQERECFKEISSVLLSLPRHPIRTSAAASGDEARPRLCGAKKKKVICNVRRC